MNRNEVALEILADLVLEDVLSDGTIFEFNPYHDPASGRFTGKQAGYLYGAGAMGAGKAAGKAAKAAGKTREDVRADIRSAIAGHLQATGKGVPPSMVLAAKLHGVEDAFSLEKGLASGIERSVTQAMAQRNEGRLKTLAAQRDSHNTKLQDLEKQRENLKGELKKVGGEKHPERGAFKAKEVAHGVASSERTYLVPGRPEAGTVSVRHSKGASLQHVAGTSTVGYSHPTGVSYEKKFHGTRARDQANRYAKDVFGIE
jgi:hypothetical protein